VDDFAGSSSWTQHNPVRIISGIHTLGHLPELVPDQGKILLVTTIGATQRGLTQKIGQLVGYDRLLIHDRVTPNPELDDLDRMTAHYCHENISIIVALGGGSVLDTAKILGVTLLCNLINPLEKMFRQKMKLRFQVRIPVIAIPTTSGTGAEVTPFSTVWDQTTHQKHSVSGDLVYPEYALLDPELTLSLPVQETLYTGLDAVSHALESLWNKNRTPISEAYALKALVSANKALPLVLQNLNDPALRTDMQSAAVLAGLAISQTRTALAHAISYPLTSYFGVPHGLACSFTLLSIIRKNLDILVESKCRFIIEDTATMLENMALPEKINNYADTEKLISVIKVHDLISNERSGNYFQTIDSEEAVLLIEQSMQQ